MLAEIPANWYIKNEARSDFQIAKKIPKIKKYFIDNILEKNILIDDRFFSRWKITTEIINKIENQKC